MLSKVKYSTDGKKIRLIEKIVDAMVRENEKIDEVNVIGGKCEEEINEYIKNFDVYVVAREEDKAKEIFLEVMKNARLSIIDGTVYVTEEAVLEAAETKVENLLNVEREKVLKMIKACGEVETEKVKA